MDWHNENPEARPNANTANGLDSTYVFVVLDQTTARKVVMRPGLNGSL